MKNIPAVLVLLAALVVASVSACEAQTRFEREINSPTHQLRRPPCEGLSKYSSSTAARSWASGGEQ